jgi:hypothetical protein
VFKKNQNNFNLPKEQLNQTNQSNERIQLYGNLL